MNHKNTTEMTDRSSVIECFNLLQKKLLDRSRFSPDRDFHPIEIFTRSRFSPDRSID